MSLAMALILIESIIFSGTNPGGTYVSGDQLDIYYDTSEPSPTNATSGITVNLNGSPITTGSTINVNAKTNPSPASLSKKSYSNICNNGYSISFVYTEIAMAFPYVLKVPIYAFAACSGDVCDLAFSPTVLTTPPSGATNNDGQIQVLATSGNPILYKLNFDFDYNDGTGLASPIFGNLYPGTFRVYARDSKNCAATILITLNYNNTYSVIYTLNYINNAGHRTKIDILKRAYGGSSSYFIGTDQPLLLDLRGESNLDKFAPIIASQATIAMIAQTDLQYAELFTNDSKQYQVNIYKDTTGGTSYSLIWSGFVVPQVYTEDYLDTPYTNTVIATDGLPNLQNYAFSQDDGTRFIGQIRVLTLIAVLLKKTNLSLHIRCSVNLFATTMNSTVNDDPLDQAYVDVDTYYLYSDTPTFDFVLSALLKPFRARIIQANGVWNIFRPEESVTTYNYREYDSNGVYLSHSSYNPVTNILGATASNRLRWAEQDQTLEIRPGFGKLRINYILGLKNNILRNGDFALKRTWNPLSRAYDNAVDLYGWQAISDNYAMQVGYELTDNASETPSLLNVALQLSAIQNQMSQPLGYVQSVDYNVGMGVANSLTLTVTVKCPSPIFLSTQQDNNTHQIVTLAYHGTYHYQKIRVRVSYGGKYLTSDGSWTNIPSDVIFYLTQWDQYVDFNITAQIPDTSYNTPKALNVRAYQSWSQDVDFTNAAALKRKRTNTTVTIGSNRGNYDASVNAFPSSGGSGGAGAIIAHDYWYTNVAGVINGVVVTVSVRLEAINTNPGQDPTNWIIGDVILSEGFKTELSDSVTAGIGAGIHFYELRQSTDAESYPAILRPDDYNASTNPYQWLSQAWSANTGLDTSGTIKTFFDKVEVKYLYNGQQPFDTIISDQPGESNNLLAIEDEIYHGSIENNYSTTLATADKLQSLGVGLQVFQSPINTLFDSAIKGKGLYNNIATFPVDQNVLAGDLIYAGYFRDSSGNGYKLWTRSSVAENSELHIIWLKTTIAQYNRSWKKITGTLYGDVFMPFINVINDLDGIIYLMSSCSLDDMAHEYTNCEFLELANIGINPGSDGTSGSAFSNGFSKGFS